MILSSFDLTFVVILNIFDSGGMLRLIRTVYTSITTASTQLK